MNKATKIVLNKVLGLLITIGLLWSLYFQVQQQLDKLNGQSVFTENIDWLSFVVVCVLVFVNIGIESLKWKRLVRSAYQITFLEAVKSVLGGIAMSIITPNRIGEYPGRILLLKQRSSTRLICVAVLGSTSSLLAILIFGQLALFWYVYNHHEAWLYLVLVANLLLCVLVWLFYWRFERWAHKIEHIKWLRKIHMYGHLLKKFSANQQWSILLLALLRFCIFTIQFYFVLQWLGIVLPLFIGLALCALFFWVMAVVPSIALAELGIRSAVGVYLFGQFSDNTIGIIAASSVLWMINLVVPSLLGSFLLLKLKLWQR